MPQTLRNFGDYVVLGEIGRGASGVVYQAVQTRLNRPVALKVLHAGLAEDEHARHRFMREAEAAASLHHPRIVPVFEAGAVDGELFLSMKAFAGGSLAERLAEHACEPRDAARLVAELARATHFAHSRGVLHRDIKPGNVLLDEQGAPSLGDFGIARMLDTTKAATARTAVIGTPSYLPPEVAAEGAHAATTTSDIYGLGAVLYEMLTGQPPYPGNEPLAILRRIGSEDIVPPRAVRVRKELRRHEPVGGASIPVDLEVICLKCLDRIPAQRYQTAQELADELDRFLNGEPIHARPISPAERAWRWCQRNRTLASTAALVLAMITGFSWHNWSTIQELRGTAPAFASEALSLLDRGNPELGLQSIRFARRLQPRNAEYLRREGELLQTLLRLPEARTAFASALRLAPADARAAVNLKLCEELISETRDAESPTSTAIERLYASLLDQGRIAEALLVARHLGRMGEESLERWRSHLAREGVPGHLRHSPDGGMDLDASGVSLSNLTALRGMPLTRLNVSHTRISDLSPLRGLPLRWLSIEGTDVSDLEPLRQLKLESLNLNHTKVENLGALNGMPLQHLMAQRLPVRDLTPLAGLPLRYLNLYDCRNVLDIRPLRGMPMTRLDLYHSRVEDLTPLRGMPLDSLNLGATRVSDLSPLTGMPLAHLDLRVTDVVDLTPLADTRLNYLNLTGTAVTNLSPLSGLPLQTLILSLCPRVRDLSPLLACATLERLIVPLGATNLTLVSALPKLVKLSDTISADHDWSLVPPPPEFLSRSSEIAPPNP